MADRQTCEMGDDSVNIYVFLDEIDKEESSLLCGEKQTATKLYLSAQTVIFYANIDYNMCFSLVTF
jgi:hypothetical protein